MYQETASRFLVGGDAVVADGVSWGQVLSASHPGPRYMKPWYFSLPCPTKRICVPAVVGPGRTSDKERGCEEGVLGG